MTAGSALQAPPPTQGLSTLHVNARLVEVNVIVNDKHGNPLSELTQKDFSILDNGKPQEIRIFSPQTNTVALSRKDSLPASVYTNRIEEKTHVPPSVTVILLDALNTEAPDQAFAWKQVMKLIEKLQPQEYVALYWLGNRLRILHEFTTDVSTLRLVLAGLDTKGSRQLDNSELADPSLNTTNPSTPAGQAFERQAFRLAFDERVANQSAAERVRETVSALVAIANHLRTRTGRKNLIWISSSFPINLGYDHFDLNWTNDTGMEFKGEVARAASALTDAGIAVYPVDARGLLGTDSTASGDDLGDHMGDPNVGESSGADSLPAKNGPETLDTMQVLAERTGGKAFYGTNGISGAIRHAMDDARVTYTLGYYPLNVKWDGSFHEIKVKVLAPGAEVRARKGYFALPEASAPASKPAHAVISELAASRLPATGIGLHVQMQPNGDARDRRLNVEVHLDLHEIRTQSKEGRWSGTVRSAFLQLDKSGKVLQADDRTFHPEFSASDFDKALQIGIKDSRRVQLLQNAAELCIVVRDETNGNVGSIYIPVEIDAASGKDNLGK